MSLIAPILNFRIASFKNLDEVVKIFSQHFVMGDKKNEVNDERKETSNKGYSIEVSEGKQGLRKGLSLSILRTAAPFRRG
jgi:hypothetical protein